MIQYHTRSQEDTQRFQETWSVENPFQYCTQDKKISGFSDGKNSSRKRRWQSRKEGKLLQQLCPPNTEFGVVCKILICRQVQNNMHRFAQKTTTTDHPKSLKVLALCEDGFPEQPIGICNGHSSSAMALFFMPFKKQQSQLAATPIHFLEQSRTICSLMKHSDPHVTCLWKPDLLCTSIHSGKSNPLE